MNLTTAAKVLFAQVMVGALIAAWFWPAALIWIAGSILVWATIISKKLEDHK